MIGMPISERILLAAQAGLSPADSERLNVIELLQQPLSKDMSLDELKMALSAKEKALKTVDPSLTAGLFKLMAKLRREIDEIERPKP